MPLAMVMVTPQQGRGMVKQQHGRGRERGRQHLQVVGSSGAGSEQVLGFGRGHVDALMCPDRLHNTKSNLFGRTVTLAD
jgi:hypothetical protein